MRAAGILWIPLLLAFAGTASADDGPARTAGRLVEPPRPSAAREVILLVGGYGTAATDGTWAALEARFAGDPRYVLRRFGADPARPYDTTGPLDANARSLIAEVREQARGAAAVHLVTHSMGGNVADRAFALGLGPADGVRSYIALAAPHAGSAIARAAHETLDRAGEDREVLRELLTTVYQDPDTSAARDLASPLVSPPISREVGRLHLRLATDLLVLHDDARGPPDVDSRILLPRALSELEGHGAILRDPRALDLIAATVRDGAPPRDERGAALRGAAEGTSAGLGLAMGALLGAVSATLLLLARVLGPFRRRAAAPVLP
ncbi:MAG TPA: hypothetical protein VFM93_05050 [Candidatus Limnocylindria bacterium]|nr:hypothetical protein [Candidatus Limnocylindria bacterium]